MAVSSDYSIDCPKAERIRIYSLVTELDPSENIGNDYGASFRPVYEDTLNSVEEFLLISLYDDWKMFMEVEESFFKHVSFYYYLIIKVFLINYEYFYRMKWKILKEESTLDRKKSTSYLNKA